MSTQLPEDATAAASEPGPGPSASAAAPGEPLVRVRNLVKHFPLTRGILFQRTIGAVRAVDGVDLEAVSYTHLTLPTNREV